MKPPRAAWLDCANIPRPAAGLTVPCATGGLATGKLRQPGCSPRDPASKAWELQLQRCYADHTNKEVAYHEPLSPDMAGEMTIWRYSFPQGKGRPGFPAEDGPFTTRAMVCGTSCHQTFPVNCTMKSWSAVRGCRVGE